MLTQIEFVKDRMKPAMTHLESSGRYTVSRGEARRVVKGSFATEGEALAAMESYLVTRYPIYVERQEEEEKERAAFLVRKEKIEALLKSQSLKGFEFLTKEPGFWLNELPENAKFVGETGWGDGKVKIYIVAMSKDAAESISEWEEMFCNHLGVSVPHKPKASGFAVDLYRKNLVGEIYSV